MRMKRLALLSACMMVAALLLPGSAMAGESNGADLQGEADTSRCMNPSATIDRVIEQSIDLDSTVDAYRFRCTLTPVDDPRTGASYEVSVFLGIACPSGAADEFCFFKSGPHVVDRVGAEVAHQDDLVYYKPGETVSVDVCVQFVPCHSVEVPLTFTLEIFDEGSQGEIEVFVIGDPTGVNPPALCTGVESECDSSLENADVSGWVY